MPGVYLKQGTPDIREYTPGAAVAAGDVVVVGNTVGVARQPIAANTLGTLAVGGAIMTGTGDAAIGDGVDVYWDAVAGKITTTSAGNKKVGRSVGGCVANNSPIDFYFVQA